MAWKVHVTGVAMWESGNFVDALLKNPFALHSCVTRRASKLLHLGMFSSGCLKTSGSQLYLSKTSRSIANEGDNERTGGQIIVALQFTP